LVGDFFSQLGGEDDLTTYTEALFATFNAAEIENPSDIQVELQEVPETCEVLVTDLRTQI